MPTLHDASDWEQKAETQRIDTASRRGEYDAHDFAAFKRRLEVVETKTPPESEPPSVAPTLQRKRRAVSKKTAAPLGDGTGQPDTPTHPAYPPNGIRGALEFHRQIYSLQAIQEAVAAMAAEEAAR